MNEKTKLFKFIKKNINTLEETYPESFDADGARRLAAKCFSVGALKEFNRMLVETIEDSEEIKDKRLV